MSGRVTIGRVRSVYSAAEWSRYIQVEVTVDGAVGDVATMVGCPDSEVGSLEAAGCGVEPYCTAWQIDPSDIEYVDPDVRDEIRDGLDAESLRLFGESSEVVRD